MLCLDAIPIGYADEFYLLPIILYDYLGGSNRFNIPIFFRSSLNISLIIYFKISA